MDVDILIYMAIVVIIGVLVVVFARNWDIIGTKDKLNSIYFDEKTGKEFDKMSPEEFAVEAYNYWNNCNYSTMGYNSTFYVRQEGNMTMLDKAFLFGHYRKLKWCASIQSGNQSCGEREDVNMTFIVLPDLVRLSCFNATLNIKVIS